MKLIFSHAIDRGSGSARRGWALLAVLTITGAAVMLVAGVISWSNENSAVAGRRNEYFSTSYVAEAATEKARSAMMQDNENYGEGYVVSHLSSYASLVPTSSDNPYFANYSFSGGTNANALIVSMISSNTVTNGAPYTGMISQGFTYEIIANAQNTQTMTKLPSTVGQKIQFTQIPMFQFAIFYMNDMEVCPGANMTVNGPVHGNANIYAYPNTGVSLTFSNDVSGSSNVLQQADPLDPSSRSTPGTLVYDGTHVSNVSPLSLPSGSGTNSLQTSQSILALPGAGSAGNPALLYNQAQMIVMVSNSSVTVTSGTANNQATSIPSSQWSLFLSVATNSDFYDQRDGLQVDAVKLDVGNLKNWVTTNASLGVIDSVYIADMRSTSNSVILTNFSYTTNTTYTTNHSTGHVSQTASVVTNSTYITNYPVTSQPGVVLTNGATLPSASGLAVATPDPVYIIGNWNVSTNGTPANLGSANTSQTYPSAIYADAITVLSGSWVNANSTANISSRTATSDTVNAAFFTGNVPSNGSYYSGGVENFPRFLENWSGQTFTYNGSMVEGLYSQIANYPWPGTGSVYNPPTRKWAFDQNFTNPQKLPPLTPRLSYYYRTSWTLLPPNTTSF